MSAKEMFEELGYQETTLKDHTIEYTKYTDDEYFGNVNSRVFTFYKREKRVVVSGFYSNFKTTLHNEELQAINKQVEELGWK